MPQSTYDTLVGVLLASLLGLAVWAIQRQIIGNARFRAEIRTLTDNFTNALSELGASWAAEMRNVAVTLAELNTGASQGAREGLASLRRDLESAARELGREVGQLRVEHDTLAERHNSLALSQGTLAERVNTLREDVRDVRRGVSQGPGTAATK